MTRACRICGEPFVPSHPERATCSEACCDRDIEFKLERLRSLRLDIVKYHDSATLIRHYAEVIRPKVEQFIRLCQLSDNEARLLDLEDLGYRLTLDEDGKLASLKLRNWGVEPRSWGP